MINIQTDKLMFKHPSIARNLTMAIGLAFLAVGGICLSIYNQFQSTRNQTFLEKTVKDYSHLIDSTLAFPMWNLDQESISDTSQAYISNEMIILLKIRDSTGKEMFLYDQVADYKKCALQVIAPIVYEKEIVGEFEIGVTDHYLNKQNRNVLLAGSLMILLCFLTMLGLTKYFLQRFLRNPLTTMKHIATEYAGGNYHVDTKLPVHQEFIDFRNILSQMGETIETQIKNLKETEEKLKQNQDHLEVTVMERTKKLKAEEQRLQAILKASPVGIGLVANRELNWANDTMYTMLGYEINSLVGKSLKVIYQDEEEFKRVELLLNSLEQNQVGSIETKLVHKNGHLLDCQIRAFPIDMDDIMKGQIVVITDITQSNLLKEQLQHAEKMETVGTLAGGVAHDLNNILSGIVSYPEVLLLGLSEDHPLRKPLLTIKKSGDRAVEIVQDLLTMTRRGVSVFNVINLNTVVKNQLASPEMKKLLSYYPGIEVQTYFEENPHNVKGSPTHLAKSVMNLLSNGAEAMSEKGGVLTVTTTSCYLDTPLHGYEDTMKGDYVILTIADTGIGISEQDKKRIFEPFYTKKSMGRSGTGLGMAVVWGTIKDHNGYVHIKSCEGKGTSISTYLPVTREKIKHISEEFAHEELRGNGESILIVDDVDTQREIASVMLKKLGYSVDAVSCGEEALIYLKKGKADLLILDMIMDPGMDGLDTYKKILVINPNQKAIVASGFSQTYRVREILEIGAGAYVKKPYTLKNIAQAVKNGLR